MAVSKFSASLKHNEIEEMEQVKASRKSEQITGWRKTRSISWGLAIRKSMGMPVISSKHSKGLGQNSFHCPLTLLWVWCLISCLSHLIPPAVIIRCGTSLPFPPPSWKCSHGPHCQKLTFWKRHEPQAESRCFQHGVAGTEMLGGPV